MGEVNDGQSEFADIVRRVESQMTQSLRDRLASESRTELGFVRDVEDKEGFTLVNWQSEHGEKSTLVYRKGAEQYSLAPNGFSVGDVIEVNFKDAARIKSARPLKLNENEKQIITSKFRSWGEEG